MRARRRGGRSGRAGVRRRSAGKAVAELAGVTKSYRGGGGIEAVDLELVPGEVFALLGPNGAGKTTTIRLLLDLIRPDAGRIRVFGLDPRAEGVAVRRRIGYLPGELALPERRGAGDVLGYLASLRAGRAPADVARLAARFGLELDRPVGALSKGNRQKVGLVQAMMGDPDLLVLDEPTSGLDPLVAHEVLVAIREAAAAGRSVLLASHVLSEVAQVADRVGILRSGRLVEVSRVETVRARSAHRVEARFAAPADPGLFAALPGARVLEASGRHVVLEVVGSLDPLVRLLARHDLDDLVVTEPSLEDRFLGTFGVLPGAPPPAGGERAAS